MGKSLEVVNRFYEATDNRRLEDLRPLVSEDVTFAGPLMKATGAKEYVAMNERLCQCSRLFARGLFTFICHPWRSLVGHCCVL